MKPVVIQLRATETGDGMTGIYWYARHLRDALQEFVDLETHEAWKWEVELFGRRWGGLITLYLGKWLGALPGGDVVHAPHLTNLHRRANVLTIHDLAFQRYPQEYRVTNSLWMLFQRRARRMPAIVTPSYTVRDELLAVGFDDDQVHAAPLGITPPPAHEPITRDRPYVVLLGEMRERKRSLQALAACGRVGIDVVRIGPPMNGSPYAKWCRDEARRHQVVHDVGYVDRQTLYSYLAGAEALVYPSIYEGFGLPPLEAASVGTPSVVGPAKVFEETLGALASPCDGTADGIEEALWRTLDAPDRSEELRDRAASYSWRRCAVQHLHAYSSAVEDVPLHQPRPQTLATRPPAENGSNGLRQRAGGL